MRRWAVGLDRLVIAHGPGGSDREFDVPKGELQCPAGLGGRHPIGLISGMAVQDLSAGTPVQNLSVGTGEHDAATREHDEDRGDGACRSLGDALKDPHPYIISGGWRHQASYSGVSFAHLDAPPLGRRGCWRCVISSQWRLPPNRSTGRRGRILRVW